MATNKKTTDKLQMLRDMAKNVKSNAQQNTKQVKVEPDRMLADAAKKQQTRASIQSKKVNAYNQANTGDVPAYRRRSDTPAGIGVDIHQQRRDTITNLLRDQTNGMPTFDAENRITRNHVGATDARKWAQEYRDMGQIGAADWFDNAANILEQNTSAAENYIAKGDPAFLSDEQFKQWITGDWKGLYGDELVDPNIKNFTEPKNLTGTDLKGNYNAMLGYSQGAANMAGNMGNYAEQARNNGDYVLEKYYRDMEPVLNESSQQYANQAAEMIGPEARKRMAADLDLIGKDVNRVGTELITGGDTHSITDAERSTAASNIDNRLAQYDEDIAALEAEKAALEQEDSKGNRKRIKEIEDELDTKYTLRDSYAKAQETVASDKDVRVYDDDAMRDIESFEGMMDYRAHLDNAFMDMYGNLDFAIEETKRLENIEMQESWIRHVQKDMVANGYDPATYIKTASTDDVESYDIDDLHKYYTDEERGMLLYAEQHMPNYTSLLREVFDVRADGRRNEAWADKLTDTNPAVNLGLAVGGRIFSTINGADISIQNWLGFGKTVNYERTGFGTVLSDKAMERGMEDIDAWLGDGTINEKLDGVKVFGQQIKVPILGDLKWSDLYSSGADSLTATLNSAAGPYAAPVVTGLQAYASGYHEAKERGASDEQAKKNSRAQAFNEGLGEKVSYDVFLKYGVENGWFKGAWGKVALGAARTLDEAQQEGATQWLNEFAEDAFMGASSQRSIDIQNYVAAGYTPEEAAAMADEARGDRIAKAAIMGAIGGLSRGVSQGTIGTARDVFNRESANAAIGRDIRNSGNAENLTQQMSIITGKDIKVPRTNRGTGKLFNEYVKAVGKDPALAMTVSKMTGTSAATKDTAETRKNEFAVSEDGKTTVGGKEVKIQGINDTKRASSEIRVNVSYADNTTGEVKLSDINFGDDKAAEVYSYAADMPTPSIANIFRTAMKTQSLDNIDRVATGFTQAYDMGRAGYRNIETVANSPLTKALTAEQVKIAYEQGVADRAEAQQKNVKEVSERVKAAMGKEWKGGTVTFDRVDVETLNDTQKRQVELATAISGMLGINVRFYESGVRNNTYQGANGSYNRKTNTISLDINAGRNRVSDSIAQTALLKTMSHEITHAIQRNSPEQYEAIREAVLDVIGKAKGVSLDTLVNEKMVKDKSLKSREAAVDEVVADACETMLRDSDAVKQLMEAHPEAAKTFKDTVLRILDKLLEAIRAAFNGNRASRESQLIEKEMKSISELWSKAVVEVAEVSGREYSTGSEDSIGDTEAFNDSIEAVQNQARPPYTDGTKACTEFVESLNEEARATYDLLYNFYQASRLGKQNLSSKFMYYTDWNAMVAKDPRWAERAQAMADVLPESIRKKMNMNPDGTLSPNTLEAEFKMNRSMGQRIIDALETEVIDPNYTIEGTTYKLSKGNAAMAVGGEAYRRAICEEVRRAYRAGTLKQARISTLSKDRWGSLGFLATNGKTGASGDFTTLCPQMFYNKGCHYCYRLAALKTGVNNKLVGANVWYGGEILRIKDSDIDMLNENGGLRIQSFGDWMPQFSSQLADMLYDAEMRGLQIKIITKEPSMIEYVAQLREQGLGKNLYFNLSADYAIERAGNRETADYTTMNATRPYMRDAQGGLWWKRAMTVQEANKYRQKYPWVNTRIVATTQEEFIRGLKDPTVDVVTGYHGNIREWERIDSETGDVMLNVEALGDAGMPVFAYDAITGEWTLEREGKTATHKALAKRIAAEGLQYEYYIKSCCIDGRCAKCKGKCGKLAKDFNIKNATNRDSESVAYWQEQMEYDETDDVQYQTREVNGQKVVWIENNILEQKPDGMKHTEYVADYLRQHIGEVYRIIESGQKVYLGEDLPGEYTESRYTRRIRNKGHEAFGAKNRMAAGIGEAVEIATNRRWEKVKHPDNKDAKYGLYRYNTSIAFPQYDSGGTLTQVHAYSADLVIRNASDGKKYLYDVVNIKNDAIKAGSLLKRETARHAQSATKLKGTIYENIIPQPASDFNTEIQKSSRDYDDLTDREVLVNALESAARTEDERIRLAAYKENLERLNGYQAELDKNKATVRDVSKKRVAERTETEAEELAKARVRIKMLNEKMADIDAALVNLETMKPIKNVVEREREKVRADRDAIMRDKIAGLQDTQNRAARRSSIVRHVKRLDQLVRNATDQKHIPDGLGRAIIDLMQNFTQDTSVFDKKRLVNIQNEYALLKESKLDSGSLYTEDMHMLLAELGNLIGGRRLSALSFDELSLVRDIIGHFEKLVKDANSVFVEGRRQSIDEITVKLVEETSGKNYKASQLKASNLYKWLTKGQITPIYFFEQLGGEMGRLGKAIIEGQSRWGRLMDKADLRVKQIQREYHYLDWVDAKDNTKVFETEAGAQIKLNREQALGIYATAKRERSNTLQQASHLASGGVIFKLATKDLPLIKGIHVSKDGTPLTKKDVSAIENWLTEEQKSYADAIVAYMSHDMAELGNETSMKLHGYRKFGEGYYYPYKTSSAHRKTNLNEVENALLKNMSFSKRTVKGATAPIEIGEFTLTCTEHIEGMIRYHSMAVEQDSFMRVFDHHLNPNQTIRSMLTSAYGENTTDYILQFMKDIYGGVTRDSNEAIGSKWLARYKKSAVMFSLSTAIQQPSSLPRAFAEVNPKYFVGKPHTGSFKEAKQYAGTAVIKEIGSFDTFNGRNAAEWLAGKRPKGIIDKTMQKIDDAGGYLPEKLDQLTWGIIWEAVKREQADKTGLDINSEELKVIAGKRYDEVMTKTQVFDSVMAKSQNMRDNSLWMKMVTSFMGESTVTYNMLYNAIANAKTNPGKASAVLGSVVLSVIMNAALKSIVTGARDDDDEKSRYSERYVKNFFADLVNGLNPLEYIPFVKDAWSIFKGFKVERTDMEAFNLAYDFWKLLQDEDRTWDQTLNTTTAFVSMLTGLPFKNIWKDISGVKNTFQSRLNEKREGRFGSAVKRGLSEGAILSLWFDDSKSANVDAMYEHLLDGDLEAANDSRKYLIDYNGVKDDKAVNTLLRTRIKEGFEDGDISREKAAEMLHEHTGLTKTEADRRVSEWAYKVDNDVAYGDIKEKFMDGDMTAEEAIEARVEYGGADEEDAEATIRKWEYEKETGFAYDDMKDNFMEGKITASDAVDARVKYGGVERSKAEETVNSWRFEREHGYAYADLRTEYEAGNVDYDEAHEALTEVGGKDDNEAYWQIAEWDYEKSGGEWHGKTTIVNDAFAGGNANNVRTAMHDIASHSDWKKPGNELASIVTDYYKPIYEAASDTEKVKLRRTILDYIKMGYEVVGEEYYGDDYALRYRSWLRD